MEGRWLVWVEEIKDWQDVVPCDDAAVERACEAMRESDGRHKTDRQIVHLVLRAAGETP